MLLREDGPTCGNFEPLRPLREELDKLISRLLARKRKGYLQKLMTPGTTYHIRVSVPRKAETSQRLSLIFEFVGVGQLWVLHMIDDQTLGRRITVVRLVVVSISIVLVSFQGRRNRSSGSIGYNFGHKTRFRICTNGEPKFDGPANIKDPSSFWNLLELEGQNGVKIPCQF